jgi:hypothetical protein
MVALVLAVALSLAPGGGEDQPPSSPNQASSSAADAARDLPVSMDRIKQALDQPPAQQLRGLDDVPHFKVEIHEKQKVTLEDLMNSLDFRSGPVPGGGLYGYEQQQQVFPSVQNPLRQPYAPFNQPELATVLVENLVGQYLGGRAASAITAAQRASAEAAAREEVARLIADYCSARPDGGAGIKICETRSSR